MRYLTFFLLLSSFQPSFSQTEQSLVAWISFDKPDCLIADELGDPGVSTFPNGELTCACGVRENSLRFDGDDDWFFLFGSDVEDALTTVDFTLSFYFKPTDNAPQSMVLFSKRFECTGDSAFAIRYNPASRSLSVGLSESQSLSVSLTETLPATSCWHHVAVVRKGGTTLLYVNGEEAASQNSSGSQRVSIENSEPLTVGHGGCSVDVDFEGFMDEIRLYDRALQREEIEDLYFSPDQINNGLLSNGVKDTTIFLGSSVQAFVTTSCAASYEWSPASGVSDTGIPNPVLAPAQTTTYALKFSDQFFCETTDSLRITVIDPSTIDCNDILLPSAFTPNADGLNDAFGISNPFVAGELLAFDILDRWGNLVFAATDPLARWDGAYKGKPVNPGVFLYKIHFRCKGEEGFKTGSVTVIR